MGFRSPVLDVSALSPSEHAIYTQYLSDILEIAGKPGTAGSSRARSIDDDKVEKQVVKRFLVDKLSVESALFDQLVSRIASLPASRLSIGEIFALLRLASHARSANSSDGKVIDDDLVFVQTDPLARLHAVRSTATQVETQDVSYEPRRRTSVREDPMISRSGPVASSVTVVAGGLNTRRLPPEAPMSTAGSSTPTSVVSGSGGNIDNLTPSKPYVGGNKGSSIGGTCTPSTKAPPPLPPKPVSSIPSPAALEPSHSPVSQSYNPFRQRLVSNPSPTPSPPPQSSTAGGHPSERRASMFSPPTLPPRHPSASHSKDGRHTTFTPSTKSGSTGGAVSSAVSSAVSGSTTPTRHLPSTASGPSGFVSYPTPSLIKEGLMAASKARRDPGAGSGGSSGVGDTAGMVRSGSGSGSSTPAIRVIKRSSEARSIPEGKLIPDSTGNSTTSHDPNDVVDMPDGGRRRSGSLLGYKHVVGKSTNLLNPLEQPRSSSPAPRTTTTTSSTGARPTPPVPSTLQPTQMYVPKAPPAPPPRDKVKSRLSMPLPPPRRKASVVEKDTSTTKSNGKPVVPPGTGLTRRTTLGSGSQSETRRLVELGATGGKPASSSDDDDAGPEEASGGRMANRDKTSSSTFDDTRISPQRRASTTCTSTSRHHHRRPSAMSLSATQAAATSSGLIDGIGRVAADVKDEWEFLTGGRGGRWAAATSGGGGAGYDDLEYESLRKGEKKRLVGADKGGLDDDDGVN